MKDAIKAGKVACVARPKWLAHVMEMHASDATFTCPFVEPRYALYYSDKWREGMSAAFDPFSDSYTDDVDGPGIAELLGLDVDSEVPQEALKGNTLAEFIHDDLPELASRRIFNACEISFFPRLGAVATDEEAHAGCNPGWFSAAQTVVRGGGRIIDGRCVESLLQIVCFPPSFILTLRCCVGEIVTCAGALVRSSLADFTTVVQCSYTPSTTHVVCDPGHPQFDEHVQTLNAYCRQRVLAAETVFKVMPLSWIEQSACQKRRLDDKASQIKARSAAAL